MAAAAGGSDESGYKVSTECSKSDLEQQKREIMEHLKKPLHEGDIWYLVDIKWFKQWKMFVGCHDNMQQSIHSDPGPIDNSSLFSDLRRDTYPLDPLTGSSSLGCGCTLKEHMIDELDFCLLPEEAWSKLVSWYGLVSDNQTVPRKVVEHGMYVKSLKVEMSPLEFKLSQHSDRQTFITGEFSRGDTVGHVMSEMKKIFSIPDGTETRVWHKFMTDATELLSNLDQSVQNAGLKQGQVLIIERKNKDGTWESDSRQRQQIVHSKTKETGPESQAKVRKKKVRFISREPERPSPKKTTQKQEDPLLFSKSANNDRGRTSAETFRNKSRETEQRLNSLKEQLKVKEEQVANLRQAEEQRDNLQRQYLREMEQHLTKCEDQLRERETVEAELLEELKTQGEHKKNVESQLMEVEQQLTMKHVLEENLQSQLRDTQQQLREKNQREETLESQLSDTQQQLVEMQEQLINFFGQFQEKELRESCLNEQLRNKEKEQENSQKQLREIEQQLTNYEGRIREKDEERANLESQLGVKDQELNELETSLSAAQQTISELRRRETCDWVIARDEIQIKEKCLGKGGWGSVIEGTYCGCVVAVKQIHELILSPHNRRLFEREMNIASRCRHPCLLQFIGATNDEGSPLFVTELMETSLRALLEQRVLSEAEICVISLDVARALNYLHQRKPSPILHRDVSSANVLLWRQGDQWRGKVSDYGTANFMQQTMTIGPGAPTYSPPEARTPNQTVKVDVYSFGVLLCEMCVRQLPDPRRREEHIILMTNRWLRGLVRRCLQTDPGARPDMPQIIHELEQFKGPL